MFNAINKTLFGAAVFALALTSCGDKNRDAAVDLYKQCESAISSGNYSGALVMLDTLNTRFADQVEIRKDALRLRAMAMQGVASDSIAAGSEELARATLELDRLAPDFRHVDSSVGLEGYYLPKGVSDKVMTATGIQPRVNDQGYFYIVANVQGRNIGLNSIRFVDGAEQTSSSEISPVRVIKVEGSESASFNPEDLEGVGQWLKEHPGASKIVLAGTKGKVDVKLDPKLRSQLIACYDYSCARLALHLAQVKREKYERMLATARDQMANLPQPTDK